MRHRLLRLLAIAFLVCAGVSLDRQTGWAAFSVHFPLFHRAQPQAWTQFRGSSDNNAVVPGRLETQWRVETGGQISASPAIADGVIYIGNNDGTLYAIDAATGTIRWKYHARNPLMSQPILDGDTLFVGEGDPQSSGPSPSEPGIVGQGPSALLAIDRRDGKLLWSTPLSGSAMPTPAIVDGILIDHDGAGWVSGWNPATGAKAFARHLESVASMTAIVPIDGLQFITAGVGTNAVFRMNALDGTLVWRSLFPENISGLGDCPPVTDGARIYCDYVAAVPPDPTTAVGRPATERVYAIDASNGDRVWDVAMETGVLPPRNEAAIPLLAGQVLVLGSAVAPVMHGIDTQTGRVLWALQTHGAVKGGAVLVDSTVYFGDLGGYLWAVDARSGHVIGDLNERAAFNVGSPVVDGRTLVIGTDGGSILAVPLAQIRNHHDV